MTGLTPDRPTPDPFSNILPPLTGKPKEAGKAEGTEVSNTSSQPTDGASTPRTLEEQALATQEAARSVPPPPLKNPKIPPPLNPSLSIVPPKNAPKPPPLPPPTPAPSPHPKGPIPSRNFTGNVIQNSYRPFSPVHPTPPRPPRSPQNQTPPPPPQTLSNPPSLQAPTPLPKPAPLPAPKTEVVAKPTETYPAEIKELKDLAETTCKEARKAVRHTSAAEDKTQLVTHEQKVAEFISYAKKLQERDQKALKNLLKDLGRVQVNLNKAIDDCKILETLDAINKSLTDIEGKAAKANSSQELAELKGKVSGELSTFKTACERTVGPAEEIRFQGTSRVHDKSAKTLRRLESTGAAISRQEKAAAKYEEKTTRKTTNSKSSPKETTKDSLDSVRQTSRKPAKSKEQTLDSPTQAPRKSSFISSLRKSSPASSRQTDGGSRRLKSFEGEISRIKAARESMRKGDDDDELLHSLIGDDLKRLCESLETKVEKAYENDQTEKGQAEKNQLLKDINQEKEKLLQVSQPSVRKDSSTAPLSPRTPDQPQTRQTAAPLSPRQESLTSSSSSEPSVVAENDSAPAEETLTPAHTSKSKVKSRKKKKSPQAESAKKSPKKEKKSGSKKSSSSTQSTSRQKSSKKKAATSQQPPTSPSTKSTEEKKSEDQAPPQLTKGYTRSRAEKELPHHPAFRSDPAPEPPKDGVRIAPTSSKTSTVSSSQKVSSGPTKEEKRAREKGPPPPQPPIPPNSAPPVPPRSKKTQDLPPVDQQPPSQKPPSRPPLPPLPPAPPQPSSKQEAPDPQADTPAPLPSEQSSKASIQTPAVKQPDTSPTPSNKPENATSKPPSIHVQRHPRSLEDQKKESDNQKADELFISFIGTVGEAFGANTEEELLKAVQDHKNPDLVAIMTDTALEDIAKAEAELKLGEENKEVQKLVKDKIRTLKKDIENPTSQDKLTPPMPRLTQSAPAPTKPTEPSKSKQKRTSHLETSDQESGRSRSSSEIKKAKTDSPRSRSFWKGRSSRRSGTGMEESQPASNVTPSSRPTVAPRPDKSLKKFKNDPSMDKLLTVLDQLSELEKLDTSGKQSDKIQKLRTQVAEAAYELDVIKPDQLTGDNLEGKKEQIVKLREFVDQIPTENQSDSVKSFREEVQSLNKHLANLESAKEAIDGLDLRSITKKVVEAKAELRQGNTVRAFEILDAISLGGLTPDELASKTGLASHPDPQALANSEVRAHINWTKETAYDLQDLASIRAVLTTADALEDKTSLDEIEAGMNQVKTHIEQGHYDQAAARLNEINAKLPPGGLSVSRDEVKKAKSPTSPVTLHENTQAKLEKTCRVLAEVSKTVQSATSEVDKYTEKALSSMEKDYEKTCEGQVYRPTEQLEDQNSSIVTQLNTVERLLKATELMLPLTTSESSKDQKANLTLIEFKRDAAKENAKKLKAHREFETNHTSIIGRVQSLEGQLSKIEENSSAAREDRISQANSLKEGIKKLKEEIEKLEPKAPQYYQDVVDNLFKRAEGISQIIDLQASAKELKTHLDDLAKVPDHELASKMREFDGTHGSELKKVEESISDLGKLEQAFHQSDKINESIKAMRARPARVQKLQRVLGEFGDTEASMRGPLKRSLDLVFNDSKFKKLFTKDELKKVTEMQQALESFVEKTKGLEEGLRAFTSRQDGMAELKEDSISNLVQLIEDNMNAFLEAYAPCVEVYEASIAPDSPLQKNEDAIKAFLSQETEVNQKKDTLAHHTSWPPAILPVQRGMRYPMLLEEVANSLDKLGHPEQASQVRDVKSKFEEQLKALKKRPN